MSVFFSILLGFSLWLMTLPVSAEIQFQRISIAADLALTMDVVNYTQGIQIDVVGQLSSTTVAHLKKILEKEKNITVIAVNSPGGDMASALEIATLIKNRQLNLVVDGRCLSACANYLFPAAANKIVLPGSVIGIHEKTYLHLEKDVFRTMPVEDAEIMLKASSDKPALEKLKQLQLKEKVFYEQLGIKADLYHSYASYLGNRKNNFGTEKINFASSYPDCPPIQMWALNKKQLISMGVTGIGDFWYPSSVEEKKKLLVDFKFPPGSIYFGEAHDLEQVCKGVSSNWVFRRFYDVKASILSKLNYSKPNY